MIGVPSTFSPKYMGNFAVLANLTNSLGGLAGSNNTLPRLALGKYSPACLLPMLASILTSCPVDNPRSREKFAPLLDISLML